MPSLSLCDTPVACERPSYRRSCMPAGVMLDTHFLGRCTSDCGTLTQQSPLLADFKGCMDWLLEPAQAEMGYPVNTPALEKACRRVHRPALLGTESCRVPPIATAGRLGYCSQGSRVMAGTVARTGSLLGAGLVAGWQAQRNLMMLGARPGWHGCSSLRDRRSTSSSMRPSSHLHRKLASKLVRCCKHHDQCASRAIMQTLAGAPCAGRHWRR